MTQMGQSSYTINKLADDTKLRGMADTPDDGAAIQGDLDRLENWTKRILVMFSKGERKVLHLRRNNSLQQYMLQGS